MIRHFTSDQQQQLSVIVVCKGKQAGKLNVRFRDEQGSLPKQHELPAMWRFPYFLDSLRSVAGVLKES